MRLFENKATIVTLYMHDSLIFFLGFSYFALLAEANSEILTSRFHDFACIFDVASKRGPAESDRNFMDFL